MRRGALHCAAVLGQRGISRTRVCLFSVSVYANMNGKGGGAIHRERVTNLSPLLWCRAKA